MRMTPTGACILNAFCQQGVELIDKIRSKRRGLVGGSRSLGVGLEVSKAFARSNLLSLCQ